MIRSRTLQQVPAPVVSGKGVDLVHDHHAQAAEQPAGIDIGRDQHHLQRLRRRQQAIGRVAEDLPPGRLLDVAVPEG